MRGTLATLGLVTLLAACGAQEVAEPSAPRTVRADVFLRDGAARTRTFSGVARAGVESQLSFKVSGTVQRVAVRVGDSVEAGALIARIDPADYELQVGDARAALARQEASARNAEATYRRTEALYENNNASLADLEAARASHDAARAAVESAQKAFERADRQLSYTVLRAPIAGAVSAVQIEEGENVSSGTPVALLSAGARVEVEVSVPEMLITGVREGQTVQVQFSAVPGRTFEAAITEVGVASIGGASAYPVRARLLRETDAVRPGMACEVDFSFEASGSRDALVVPPSAVAEDIHGRFAFVVRDDADGTLRAHRVAVTVGDLTSDGIEVLDGIEDGARVVTAGVGRLVDGEPVRIWQADGGGR